MLFPRAIILANAILRGVPEPAWLANLVLRSPGEELMAFLAALVPLLEGRFVRVCTELGLSRAQAQVLVQLPSDLSLSQREMSQRLHCAPSAVVGLIDSLEERGWLARQVDRADRRVNSLVLTREGRDAREQLIERLLDPPAALQRL